jgi:hypothetical protein
MYSFRILILVPFVVLVGCGGTGKKRFGDQTVAVLSGATKVEVFRTDGANYIGLIKEKDIKPDENRMGGFLVTAQGKDQGKEFAARLAKILFDERTYSDTRANCFWPGVAFRVWKEQEFIELLICFKCDNFYCGLPQERTMENASFWGSPLRPELVRMAKEAFPDDKEIQELGLTRN